MKRIMIISLAILLMGSLANAGMMYDPYNGPIAQEVMPVYAAAALDAGDVVVWAIGDSDTNDDTAAWVASTTTAGTGIVAGVVWPNAIVTGGTGTIVTYGMAECDTNAGGASAMGTLCTTTTAGAGGACATATSEAYSYAFATATATASAQVKCFVTGK